MKISIFGGYYLPFLKTALENDGHVVLINYFSPDIDVCIVESRFFVYQIYKILKIIKKNKIKLINSILDIPLWTLQKSYIHSTNKDYAKQFLYNNFHKSRFLSRSIDYLKPNPEKSKIYNFFFNYFQAYFNSFRTNKLYFLKNYRNFLKKSDLVLSLSKYTQKAVKKFLKLNTKVCYPCVNSDYLINLKKEKILYDAINISRIVSYKRQELFVKAAKKIGLNVLVLGSYDDKSIKLKCPHYFLADSNETMKVLNKTSFYVAPTIFEGFGMTSVEAAFLRKPVVASDIYVHKEVLGEYPIYFKRDNLDDLIEKMRIVAEGSITPDNTQIVKKYSIQALKKRIIKCIESIK